MSRFFFPAALSPPSDAPAVLYPTAVGTSRLDHANHVFIGGYEYAGHNCDEQRSVFFSDTMCPNCCCSALSAFVCIDCHLRLSDSLWGCAGGVVGVMLLGSSTCTLRNVLLMLIVYDLGVLGCSGPRAIYA